MPDDPTELSIELADELREITRALVDQALPRDQVERVLKAVRATYADRDGPRRPRWYEEDSPNSFGSDDGGAFGALSPVRGQLNPVAPPLRLERGERDDGTPCIIGHANMSAVYEGPPRGVHGGLVAALFDEILGAAMVFAPPPGVTARLEVDYHHLTPIGEDLHLEARIVESRGRRVRAEATCHAGTTLTARAKALFIRVDFDAVEDRMRSRAADREDNDGDE